MPKQRESRQRESRQRESRANRPVVSRRILRRRLLRWSLPFTIVLVLMAGKLIAQHVIAEVAIAQYRAGDFEPSLNTGKLNEQANVVESWKTPYLIGTDYLRLDALDEAKSSLREALAAAPITEQCPIRENLAIAHERSGDLALEAQDAEEAAAQYREALQYLEERDSACDESTSARAIADSVERISEKLKQLEQPPDDGGSDTPPPPPSPPGTNPPDDSGTSPTDEPGETQPSGPGDDRLDELENNMGENGRDRQEYQDGLGNGNGYGGGSPDKPW